MTPKLGFPPCSGSSMEGTYLLAMRCPVYRRHDAYPGFRTELENRVGDDCLSINSPATGQLMPFGPL
jgi:hypothetical protein